MNVASGHGMAGNLFDFESCVATDVKYRKQSPQSRKPKIRGK